MSRVFVSLIQSDYGRPGHGNLEAVIAAGQELWHWFRDNSSNDFGPWVRGVRISGPNDTVTGPGCLIQSNFRAGAHGNLELVVPLHLSDDSIELRHFYHDNTDVRLPWTKAHFVTQSCAGTGGLIQSRFDGAAHGNFEVITGEPETRSCITGIRISVPPSGGSGLIASTCAHPIPRLPTGPGRSPS